MIYICVPYYNEQLIAKIRLEEDRKWANEEHICESNRTFKYGEKDYNFPEELKKNEFLHYHKLDSKKVFVSNSVFGKMKLIPYRFSSDLYEHVLQSPAWYNDAQQRNYTIQFINPADDDIVIISDIDEVIDSRYANRLIDETYARGIVTCKLHFTMFYFNLYVKGWSGAPDYSYRLFSMTGKKFKSLNMSSDKLRKLGEQGKLLNEIYCIDDFLGFHHSWIGNADKVYNKINSYAHTNSEHSINSREQIEKSIKEGKSIFPQVQLVEDASIELIESVSKYQNIYPELFWKIK